MKSRDLIFNEILKNQNISNKELEDKTGLNEAIVKTTIYRLKQRGVIVDGDKDRFSILKNVNYENNEKKALYSEMIDVYMEDFLNASTFEDRLKVGREIRLLIERL